MDSGMEEVSSEGSQRYGIKGHPQNVIIIVIILKVLDFYFRDIKKSENKYCMVWPKCAIHNIYLGYLIKKNI